MTFSQPTLQGEFDLFIACNVSALEDFLETDRAIHKHIYCCFPLAHFCFSYCKALNARKVHSISFQDAYTLYPPFKRP
ncbi:hypothetical protein [Vibrio sp. Vb339]|uniref:hypothetical protein n=1 Tax=Vibrio sp. Vb339 TaxID=1192013 RepID=UPI0015533A92|nr:hypothetical protein [Vibrio sp. Vb339]